MGSKIVQTVLMNDVIDHSKHLHPDPDLEAILVEFVDRTILTGNVIHDHPPMEVRINWVMQSAEGISSGDNLASDMNGTWKIVSILILKTIEDINHNSEPIIFPKTPGLRILQ